jgi:predicted O-methyltransferase YrrM
MIGSEPIHYFRHWLGLDEARTQTTVAERQCLSRHAKGKRRAAEIGVFEGVSTKAIRKGMDGSGKLFAVDPFPPGRVGISWNYLIARKELGDAVEFVRLKSADAARVISGSFDFVFIDGDHSMETITKDWTAWSPRVVPNGVVCLHDTRMRPELGSQQYFETTISRDTRFAIVEQMDSLSVLRRVP